MIKKYEILKDESISHKGVTLYRIKALVDFNDVQKGDIGGYVQGEHNLAQTGSCWLYKEAKAYNNAAIFGNACASDSVEVYGEAKIYGNARLFWTAKIGTCQIFGESMVC